MKSFPFKACSGFVAEVSGFAWDDPLRYSESLNCSKPSQNPAFIGEIHGILAVVLLS